MERKATAALCTRDKRKRLYLQAYKREDISSLKARNRHFSVRSAMQFFHRNLTSLPLVLLMGLIACTNALPVDNDYDLALKPRETDDPFEFDMDGCRGVTCTATSCIGRLTEHHQSQLACAGPFWCTTDSELPLVFYFHVSSALCSPV